MKTLAFTLILALTTPCLASLSGWEGNANSHAKIISQAKKQQTPVIVYFYVDWCGYCKNLNQNYLQHPEIQKILKEIPKVQINPETSFENKKLSDQYNVKAYPSFYVFYPTLNSPKKKLSPFFSSKNNTPVEFAQRLKNEFSNLYSKQGKQYANTKKTKKALEYFAKALELNPKNTYALSMSGFIHLTQAQYSKSRSKMLVAQDFFKKALKELPTDKQAQQNLDFIEQWLKKHP